MRPTVADHVAQFLVDRGVEHVFGICGHTNISLLAAFERARERRASSRPVTSRSRPMPPTATRGHPASPAWCFCTSVRASPTRRRASPPPRSTRFRCSSSPATCLPTTRVAGRTRSSTCARDADQVSVYEPFVKRAWRVRRADQVPRVLARAWDLALAGRPGPVLVSVPDGHPRRAVRGRCRAGLAASSRPTIRRQTAGAIAEQLRAAERPLILAGGGTRRAAAEVRATGGAAAGLPVAAHADGHRRPAAGSSAAAWA